MYWWLRPQHITNLPLFVVNSVVIFWTLLLPAYFFFFALRMKKPNPKLKLPNGLKVAMVVTKAPSEPFEVVKKTLLGMLKQEYPHDTWIADEDPTSEVLSWAREHNVFVSTRKGIPEFNRPEWPRREKSKEGNLTYFYEKYGYEKYDFVIQLDADHIPQRGYLKNMLLPFLDKQVGYVSAPSICSNNAKFSWTARARLYAEALLHGAQQAGHTNGFAPLCFGSHYAVRVSALKQIGGLGPELAEDHSTSLIMNSKGWKGVHAINAIAIGDGPETFTDAMTQEFQWSRSIMNILLMWTPKYISGLPLRLKIQFVFSQLWYPLFSFMILFGYLIPLLAIIFDISFVDISYVSFLGFNALNLLSILLVVYYVKSLGLMRPINAKLVSWEMIIFQLARWPWVIFGIYTSIYDFILKRQFSFKVTPKNRTGYIPLPLKVVAPYVILVGIYLTIGLFWQPALNASGYYYFVITGVFMYFSTLLAIIFQHENEQKFK